MCQREKETKKLFSISFNLNIYEKKFHFTSVEINNLFKRKQITDVNK